MSLYDSVRGELRAVIKTAHDKVEAGALGVMAAMHQAVLPAIPSAMQIAEDLAATGLEKKAVVLQFLAELYDQVIEPIDLPGPDNLIDPALKKLMLVTADKLIDQFAAFFHSSDALSVIATFQPNQA
ncbi:MAG: hypothetical protein K8U03_09340 [Planctomycetia bacterium]|nr:hypothetical protein [Planctomycetia bacterium]